MLIFSYPKRKEAEKGGERDFNPETRPFILTGVIFSGKTIFIAIKEHIFSSTNIQTNKIPPSYYTDNYSQNNKTFYSGFCT